MKNYSILASPSKSKGRIFIEKKSTFRSDYQRDRDRIIHSTSFRRLKHKTQVFVNTSSDHYRTRMTHSLEVSQIARTLAKFFLLNEDLTETLSLAHDLGHTPFGHAGEEALNDCMSSHGGFDHNLQTIRNVTLLEKKYPNFDGLNLTFNTLEGLLKHNGPIQNQVKVDTILGKNFFKKKINYSQGASLEAQLASISDDIAYNSHDLEDGLKSGLIKLEELYDFKMIKEIIKKIPKFKVKKNERIDTLTNFLTRYLIDFFVNDVIKTTKKNIEENNIKKFSDLKNQKYNVVNFSAKAIKLDKNIKEFLKEKMYNNKRIKKKADEGKVIVKKLYIHILKKTKRYIKKYYLDKQPKERCISDFIAGMTDRYAINLYKNLK